MAGLVPGQDPGDVVQFRLVVRQVRERDGSEQIVDPLLQHAPDRPDAARGVRTTSVRVDGMEIAVDFEGDVLRGLDDVLHRDRLRVTREVVAALGAADRIDQAGAPQAEEDLLDVIVGKPFLLGELARRDRPLARPLGEVQGNDQTILGPGGYGRYRPIPPVTARYRPISGSRSPRPALRTRSRRCSAAATAGAC